MINSSCNKGVINIVVSFNACFEHNSLFKKCKFIICFIE